MRPVALSIAGSDPSGGAGIQADLKTFHQHGVYGCAVVTLLTAQSSLGVQAVEQLPGAFVDRQLGVLLEDLQPAGIKTGALGSAEVVEVVAARVQGLRAPLVVDPVTLSKNNTPLLARAAREALLEHLLPHADLVTPNLDEARWLSGRGDLADEREMAEAARAIADLGPRAVLIKGGHRQGRPIDLLYWQGRLERLEGERVATRHTHGLGCALSAAICARLAAGESLEDACALAKRWVAQALAQAPGLGAGAGPIEHAAEVPVGTVQRRPQGP